MADDLFDESTMTFGEHIEALRVHMISALKGVVLVGCVMVFFGQNVVKIIVDPVEKQLHTYYTEHLTKRTQQMEQRQQDLPAEAREWVAFEATFSPEQLERLAQAIAPDQKASVKPEPITLTVNAPIGNLLQKLALPMADLMGRFKLKTLSAQEAFMIYFKAVLGASIVASSPWVFYQLYSFIAVGLYAHERRFVHLTLPFSVCLFLLGVGTCFFLVFPAMLKFFLAANDWIDLEPDFRLSEWVGFAVLLTIIFGAVFQMPLLMLMLERVGIVTHDQLAGKRRIAWFVNFIVAAMITPGGDPNTMVLLAIPMCFLFELGLFLMRYFQKRNPFAVEDPTADREEFF